MSWNYIYLYFSILSYCLNFVVNYKHLFRYFFLILDIFFLSFLPDFKKVYTFIFIKYFKKAYRFTRLPYFIFIRKSDRKDGWHIPRYIINFFLDIFFFLKIIMSQWMFQFIDANDFIENLKNIILEFISLFNIKS